MNTYAWIVLYILGGVTTIDVLIEYYGLIHKSHFWERLYNVLYGFFFIVLILFFTGVNLWWLLEFVLNLFHLKISLVTG